MDKSDKYAVFMLLWLIAGAVVSISWFPIVANVLSLVYAVMAIYCTFKEV